MCWATKPAGHVLLGHTDRKSQRQQPSLRIKFLACPWTLLPRSHFLPSYLWYQMHLPAATLNIIRCECLKIVNLSAGNFSTPAFSVEEPKRYGVPPSPAGWGLAGPGPPPRGFSLGCRIQPLSRKVHEGREEPFRTEWLFNNCNENYFWPKILYCQLAELRSILS